MAHKKAGGSSRNGRDSAGHRLGVKKFGGGGRHSGQHHRAPARHEVAPRHQCRDGQGSHPVRPDRGPGRVPDQARPRLRGGGTARAGGRVDGGRLEQAKQAPPVSHTEPADLFLDPGQRGPASNGTRGGGWGATSLCRLSATGLRYGDRGERSPNDVPRSDPRRRLPDRDPQPVAALAARQGRGRDRAARGRAVGGRDDGADTPPYRPGGDRGSCFEARRRNASGEGLGMAVSLRSTRTASSASSVSRAMPAGRRRIGYWLGRPFWGRGLATEAAAAMVAAYSPMPAARCSRDARVTTRPRAGCWKSAGFVPHGNGD